MLGAESRVPVDFRIVELEEAVLFSNFYGHIVRTSKDFVSEGSELILLAYLVDLVDDSADCGVLVYEDGGYEGFVGKVMVAKIKVGLILSAEETWKKEKIEDCIPTWPTTLKPTGISSCSLSGRMADMMSSVIF